MKKIYDVENLVADLSGMMKAQLNTKLAQIDAEKDDGTTMLPVPDEAYFFQDIHREQSAVYDAFAVYIVEDPDADGIGPHTAQKLTVIFLVCVRDTAETRVYQQRLMRYSRALKEIFEEGFSRNRGGCKLSISGISPTHFAADGIDGAFTACGVKVKTALA